MLLCKQVHTPTHSHLHNMQIYLYTNRQSINSPAHKYTRAHTHKLTYIYGYTHVHTFPHERKISGRKHCLRSVCGDINKICSNKFRQLKKYQQKEMALLGLGGLKSIIHAYNTPLHSFPSKSLHILYPSIHPPDRNLRAPPVM